MKFCCESKTEIPLPPKYTFPQEFNYLNKDNNSFYILEEDEIGYVQCAGEKLRCCIEFRDHKTGKQYRLAKGINDDQSTQIEMSNGHVTVRIDEILTIEDAIKVFNEFYKHKILPIDYRINIINQGFYSKSAQQGDAPEPASPAR